MDWMTAWGVGSALGFVFKSVLAPLAGDTVKDWLKDFCKGALINVFERSSQRELKRAAGQAITEFLALFQAKLQETDVPDEQLLGYEKALKIFITHTEVLQYLGEPLRPEANSLDAARLLSLWKTVIGPVPALPTDFHWQGIARLYPKKVSYIIQSSLDLRQILDSVNLDRIAAHTQQLAGPDPGFDTNQYAKELRKQWDDLDIENLAPTSCYYELKLWDIFIPQTVRECREYLPQFHELPKDIQLELKKSGAMPEDIDESELLRYRDKYREQPIRSVLEVIFETGNRNMVFLGDPGAGKSSLLRYLALDWARKFPAERLSTPMPLLIELRQYSRDCEDKKVNDFLDFYHQGNVFFRLNRVELKKQLESGQVIAMFDGLDEILDPARRIEVATDIHRFSIDYHRVRILITSRVMGYKQRVLKVARFRHFLIQELEANQVKEFISRWHGHIYTKPQERERKKNTLLRAVAESSPIRQLAGNPLLLTLMAIINRSQELPRNRVALYKQASHLLMYHWDVERQLRDNDLTPETVDHRDKEVILRRVAHFMQQSERGLAGNLIYRDDLERIVRLYLVEQGMAQPLAMARRVIEHLRVRNFLLCHKGGDWFAFIHRNFLEYFCAAEFVRLYEKEQTLSFEKLREQIFGQHWGDGAWHEVLRLICGMIDSKFAGALVKHLMQQGGEDKDFGNLFLAAECLGEVHERTGIELVVHGLQEKLKTLVNYKLWYDSDSWDLEGRRIIQIRAKAVSSLASCLGPKDGTRRYLRDLATDFADINVRCTALSILARDFQHQVETFHIIKQRVFRDENPNVRSTALRAVIQYFKQHPDTFNIFKERSTIDSDWIVRRDALNVLAEHFNQYSEVFKIIKQRVKVDINWNVRIAAVKALYKHFSQHAETYSILKDCSTADKYNVVRNASILGMVQHFRQQPETFAIIKQRATEDKSITVRRTASKILSGHYPQLDDNI